MPELLDIRDEHGTLMGEAMVRPEVHRTEAWHGVALIWVYNSKGQLLMQLRAAHLNAFPEKWDVTVSGHLMSSEKPLQAAQRELGEEIGVYVSPGELQAAGELANPYPLTYGKIHREYDYIFLTKQDNLDISKLTLQAAEVLELRWITPDELEKDLADPVKRHHYSERDARVYQLAIEAVRSQLKANPGNPAETSHA
jgi:isopentenyldiphosphate isomerase